ncbi:MAG: hypothetical protein OEV42_21235 [Deltaproteobacteria bacterium]|nr:hypothetical protein [Deltaproteobacteria bacterium]
MINIISSGKFLRLNMLKLFGILSLLVLFQYASLSISYAVCVKGNYLNDACLFPTSYRCNGPGISFGFHPEDTDIDCAQLLVGYAIFECLCGCTDYDGDGARDTWYYDFDGDGFTYGSISSCEDPNVKWPHLNFLTAPSNPLDCDDYDASKKPVDGDGDGYTQCNDCNDDDISVFIKEVEEEICMADGKDNDCDGTVDERNDCKDCRQVTGIDSTANVASGQYKHSQNLFGYFSLYYDSFSIYSGTVARNWRHSYEIDLEELVNGRVALSMPDGAATTYIPFLEDYVAESGDNSSLVKNADGTWDMTELDGTVYHFDAFGNISSISDIRGRTTTFSYYSGLLTSVADSTAPAPVFIDYVDGKIDTVTDPSGNIYDFNYYPDGTLEEIIYPLPASYTLDVPQPDGTTASVSYPEAGAVNPKWSYTYETGLLKTKTDPSGKLVTYGFDNGKVTSSTVTTEYGVRTRTLGYSNYTGDMRETLKTELDGGVWKFRYSKTEGKLKEKEDPEGGITFYTYNGDYRTAIHPGGKKKTTTRYDVNNNVVASIEEELVSPFRMYSTAYTYDANGRILTMRTPLEGAYDETGTPVPSLTTTYDYNDKGETIYTGDSLGRETFIQYTTVGMEKQVTTTDPLGRVSIVVYDDKDRLLSSTAPSSVTGVDAATYYTYGVLGNMSTVTDTAGRVTRYKYDSLGRMVQLIGPNEERATYVYNANGSVESVIDAEGNKTSYTYTNLGQQKSIIDALNNATFMSYSAAGCGNCSGGVDKLTQVTDANGKATSYTYDKLGRLLTERDATGLQKRFSYHSNRYEYTKTDADGIAITYVNDYMDRLIEKKVDGVTKETYSYYINGWRHTASKDDLTYTYTYYADGQVRTVADGTRTITYTYDLVGNKTSMNVSGLSEAVSVGYSYTDAYQPDTITATGAGMFDYDYNVDGSRESLSYPNTVFSNYSYDALGRLVGITNGVADSSYSHYPSGNRKSHTKDDGTVVSYEYDDLYRLKFVAYSSDAGKLAQFENYSYDAIGNRLAHDKVIFSIYSGQQKQIGASSYDYDYENRLVRVKRSFDNSSTVVTYDYDVFGRRVGRTVATDGVQTASVRYFYDNEDIIAELDGAGNVLKVFVHGPGIDEPLAVKDVASGNWYYYHADGLGSVLKLTDASGTPVAGYSFGYDSFGNLVKGTLDRNYTYTGREWDEEVGLYYYRARFYDPEVGRFISKDPLGFDGGDYNLYSYVGQNPVNKIDPLGLFEISGICRYISGGEVFGVGVLRCKVWTDCRPDNTREKGEVVAILAGATAGLPISVTYFNIKQKCNDLGNPRLSVLEGNAYLGSASAAIGFGSAETQLNLGSTYSFSNGYQAGIDASVDVFAGYSYLDGPVETSCCPYK